jgi:hypothetical protein
MGPAGPTRGDLYTFSGPQGPEQGKHVPEVGLELDSLPRKHRAPVETCGIRPDPTQIRTKSDARSVDNVHTLPVTRWHTSDFVFRPRRQVLGGGSERRTPTNSAPSLATSQSKSATPATASRSPRSPRCGTGHEGHPAMGRGARLRDQARGRVPESIVQRYLRAN